MFCLFTQVNRINTIKCTSDFVYRINCRKRSTVSYDKYYRILELEPNADQESVRKAFITLCKKYHPDNGKESADSNKFHEVEDAYRKLQKKFSEERWNVNEGLGEYGLYYKDKQSKGVSNDVEEQNIEHTAPQHRQYLSWDGVGSGTLSQRQHQYSQLRAAQAAERVREHRLEQLNEKGDSLTVQEHRRIQKVKTRYGMDRLVEDLIQESMSRGDFENLSGAGKPLPQSNFNPYVDFITHKMNQVLIDNGFTPEWITLAKEIEEEQASVRNKLKQMRNWNRNSKKWQDAMKNIESSVKALNKKIQLFNLVVPIITQQQLLFNLESESKNIFGAEDVGEIVEPISKENLENRREPSSVFDILTSIFRHSHN